MDIDTLFESTLEKLKEIDLSELSSEWVIEPPTFDEFISSGRYITPVVLSKKQYDSAINVLGTNPKKIFSPDRIISLGVLCIGKGGGKDWLVAIIMCFVVTVILHLKNPQRFFMIDGNLDILNVSISGKNADQIFFDAFRERVKENKYLLENYDIYEQNKKFNTPSKKSKGIIKIGASSIIFPNRLRCYSETSNNESWEGYNVIFFVLDEISGFKTEKKASNGWNIYNTAKTSCISRRTKNFKGIGFVISYPRQEKGDIIIDLYEMSRKIEWMYGLRCFAWHFKPDFLRTGETFTFVNKRFNRAFNIPEDKPVGIKIPIEYKDDFDTDPENSLTYYCAIPPRAAGTWIEYPDRIYAAVDPAQKPLFLTDDYVVERTLEDGKIYKFKAKKIIGCTEPSFDVRRNYSYVAWLDNAETNCDAVIAIARKEIIKTVDEQGRDVEEVICRIVDVINWLPEPGLPIDLQSVEDFLLKEIPRYINLKEVGKDRWESALLHNKLIKKGVNSIRYALREEQYNICKYFFYLGAVRIFNEEEYYLNSRMKEMTSLEQIVSLVTTATGPDKKPDLKKDKSDAVCGCINLLLGNEWQKTNRPKTQKVGLVGKPISTTDPYNNKYVNIQPQQVSISTENNQENNKSLPLPRLVK